MMKVFYIEFTANDRLAFEVRIHNNQFTGLRIKVQTYCKTNQVISDIKGFEPFNAGEWMTLVKYDNLKGEAIRDAMRPTPVSHSPLGLHLKENWGYLDLYTFLDRILEDIKSNWQKDYFNYGSGLPALLEERLEHARRNFPLVSELARYILHDRTILEQLNEEQSMMPIPVPGRDDWLIDENTAAMSRIYKLALRGKLSMEMLGHLQIATHRPRQEGEDIAAKPVV